MKEKNSRSHPLPSARPKRSMGVRIRNSRLRIALSAVKKTPGTIALTRMPWRDFSTASDLLNADMVAI